MSEEIEDLTQMFSEAGMDLVRETIDHRAL
jgi:hypothetical protein